MGPSSRPTLSGNEAHIWRVFLIPGEGDVRRQWGDLAPEERERAERFHTQRDRDRFILARSALRAIIGRYLDVAPADVRFSYHPHGKPGLDGGSGSRLRFNLAHSRDLALCALTHGREVGIDVEYMRDGLTEGIAERFFSPLEAARLKAVPPERRQETFFRTWTCKEAYVKAMGDGLLVSLDRFSISIGEGEPPRLTADHGDPTAPHRWSFLEMAPAEGYVGAMATEGTVQPVFWQWNPWSPAGAQ